MRYQIKNEQGEWVDGMPTTHLQPYRQYFSDDFYIESYWADPNHED